MFVAWFDVPKGRKVLVTAPGGALQSLGGLIPAEFDANLDTTTTCVAVFSGMLGVRLLCSFTHTCNRLTSPALLPGVRRLELVLSSGTIFCGK
jgi:hypothetical protein